MVRLKLHRGDTNTALQQAAHDRDHSAIIYHMGTKCYSRYENILTIYTNYDLSLTHLCSRQQIFPSWENFAVSSDSDWACGSVAWPWPAQSFGQFPVFTKPLAAICLNNKHREKLTSLKPIIYCWIWHNGM